MLGRREGLVQLFGLQFQKSISIRWHNTKSQSILSEFGIKLKIGSEIDRNIVETKLSGS